MDQTQNDVLTLEDCAEISFAIGCLWKVIERINEIESHRSLDVKEIVARMRLIDAKEQLERARLALFPDLFSEEEVESNEE